MPPLFPTYEAYHEYLRGRYSAIVVNARDVRRANTMSILSAQSRGYDTTALNGLATEFGVDTAFTVPEGEPVGAFAEGASGQQQNDDGAEICALLGIPCVSIDRRSYQREFDDEYLYYAALERNQDVNLREIAQHLSGVGCCSPARWASFGTPAHPTTRSYRTRRYTAARRPGRTRTHRGSPQIRICPSARPYIGARRR